MRKRVWMRTLAILLIVAMTMADLSIPVQAASVDGAAELVSANEVEEEIILAERETATVMELDIPIQLKTGESTELTFTPTESGYYSLIMRDTYSPTVFSDQGIPMESHHSASNMEEIGPDTYTYLNVYNYYFAANSCYTITALSDAAEDSGTVTIVKAKEISDTEVNNMVYGTWNTYVYTPKEDGLYVVDAPYISNGRGFYAESNQEVLYPFYDVTLERLDENDNINNYCLQIYELLADESYVFSLYADNADTALTFSKAEIGEFKAGSTLNVDGYWIGQAVDDEPALFTLESTGRRADMDWISSYGDELGSYSIYGNNACYVADYRLVDNAYVVIRGDITIDISSDDVYTIQCDQKQSLTLPKDESRYIAFTPEKDGMYSLYAKGGNEIYSCVNFDFIEGYAENLFTFTNGYSAYELTEGITYIWEVMLDSDPIFELPESLDCDMYVSEFVQVDDYQLGTNVSSFAPVKIELPDVESGFATMQISGVNKIFLGKEACYDDGSDGTGGQCESGTVILDMTSAQTSDKTVAKYNTVEFYSAESDATQWVMTELIPTKETLSLGQLKENEPGAYEYTFSVEETGKYKVLKEISAGGDTTDVHLYRVEGSEDNEVRTYVPYIHYGFGFDDSSEDEVIPMEYYYELEAEADYVLTYSDNKESTICISRSAPRAIFDYDEYYEFIEAGGTVTYEPAENAYGSGYPSKNGNVITYANYGMLLTISAENFKDQNNIWLLRPLQREDMMDVRLCWDVAPNAGTYADLADLITSSKYNYQTETLSLGVLATRSMYTLEVVDGNSVAVEQKMDNKLGEDAILLAKRSPAYVPAIGIELDVPTTMKTGDSAKIGVTLVTGTEYEATNQEVTFKSSDASVLKVDAEGNITALKPGMAIITVKSTGGYPQKKVTITVTKQTYTISYELNGGTNNTANPASYAGGKTVTLQTPTKKGYTFEGWYTDPDFAEETQITKLTKGNYVVYAKWSENHYDIAFNGNHATVTGEMPAMTEIGYDDVVTLSENGFERTGYSFKGWNTKADGSGTTYADGATVSKLNKNDGSTVTLYAIWTKDKYTINYELDGGTNNKANPATYTVSTKTITLAAPTKKGYTFDGWYKDEDCEEEFVTTITKGSTGNVTLYAKWTEHQYSIVFNGNHASVTGEMSDMTEIGYDDPVTLSENGFEREGYTFKSWNTKADGSGKSYAAGAEVSKLASKDGAVVILYAIWTKDKYTITYELDGGTNNTANPTTYTVTTKTTTLAAPTKKGYTFGGWYTDAECQDEAVTTILKGSTGNKTLYAKWTENQYNIAFNSNHAKATGEMETVSGIGYDDVTALPANEFARTGYTFKSWNTKADGSGKSYADGAEVSKLASKDGKVVNLYAIWTKDKYTITYELDGGTNNTANPVTYTVTTKTITLAAPTKKGYTFGGWYTDAECQDEAVTTILKGSTGNKTLYAKWTENQYNIAFNSNHAKATGEMETISGIGYDDPVTLSENGFEREGYTFKCWNTKADGTGKTYTDGAEVSKLASKDGKTVTLYAIWQKEKYTINYVVEDGTNNANNPATYTITTTTITLKKPKYTGDGFNPTFGGWYTSPDFEEDTKVTTIPKGSTGNMTLYAKWIFG